MGETANKRVNWIDMLRGFSILLIVLGHVIVHCNQLEDLYIYLNSFYVPIFFIITGLVIKVKPNIKYKDFFAKTFKRIMIPYFIFAIAFLIPYILFGNEVRTALNKPGEMNIGKIFFGIIYGNGHDALLKQNSALWFLPCLFIVEQVYFILEKIKRDKKENIFWICSIALFFILGYISYKIPHIRLPWGIDVAIVLIPFLIIGKLFITNINKYNIEKYKMWLALLLIIGGYILQEVNSTVSCMDHIYGDYILFLLSTICTCLGILLIFYKTKNIKSLQYIGKNTMAILIFHKLIVVIFQTKLGIISNQLKTGNIIVQILLSVTCLIITTIICLVISNIIRKILPILIGENKEKVSGKNSKQK